MTKFGNASQEQQVVSALAPPTATKKQQQQPAERPEVLKSRLSGKHMDSIRSVDVAPSASTTTTTTITSNLYITANLLRFTCTVGGRRTTRKKRQLKQPATSAPLQQTSLRPGPAERILGHLVDDNFILIIAKLTQKTCTQINHFIHQQNNHQALCIICLILEEISKCYTRDYRLLEWVSSYGLIFSILVLVMFCVRFHHALENYVNLPLSLMVNEVILAVLFILAGVSVLVSLCAGAAKIGGIFAGVSTYN